MSTEKVVRKHVAIIHAYSMMSALQRKIVNVLLYNALNATDKNINPDSVAVECHMPLSALAKAVQFKSHNTQYIKESVDGLASLKIEWNLLKDRVPIAVSFLNLRVLQGSPTFYQDGSFHFSFHKVMLELLKNPSIYGTIDLDIQSQFESKYGHALYENASRLVNLQKEKVIEVDIFKKLFCVQPDKYNTMRELTRNVIAPAIEEVNDRAPFNIDIERIKSGNKVTAFKLHVEAKKATTQFHLKKEQNHFRAPVLEAMTQTFGNVKLSILEDVLQSYSDDYILEKINYVRKNAKKSHMNLYPIAYFLSALKNDYQKSEPIKSDSPTKPKMQSMMADWDRKKRELESDLLAWQARVGYFEGRGDEKKLQDVLNIVSQCKKNLNTHFEEKPIFTILNTDV